MAYQDQLQIVGDVVTTYRNGTVGDTYTITDAILRTGTQFFLGRGPTTTTVEFDNLTIFGAISRPATWIVATNGSPVGDGSISAPMDWRTAMGATLLIQGGDTVLDRGGDHGTSGDAVTVCTIGGTTGNPVLVRRYPGDTWPRHYTALSLPTTSPGNIKFYGLQFVQNNPDRINNYRGDNPSYGSRRR